MSNKNSNLLKRPEISGALIIAVLIFSMFLIMAVPFYQNGGGIIPPQPPEEPYNPFNPPVRARVADEPNLTRTGYPFILKNYPNLKWKPANESGTGTAQYPTIFSIEKGLIGLNASNIRVAYYDSDYNWQIVPFQIDQVGWPNIWQINDLDYFSGIDAGLGGMSAVGGSFGLGWINGDPSTNDYEDSQDYGDGGNVEAGPWKMAWYPTPVHTYVTPKQPDGSYTSEDVNIDPTLRSHLIWAYQNSPQADRDSSLSYGGYTENWVNSTNGAASGLVYMGDTWFQTPWWNPQIDGFIDWDDEIAFYTYNGRQVPGYIWWNYTYFPHRFELEIIDPVDGGRSWMYIYYNNDSNFNFYTNSSAKNLGAPKYTTPISDYVSWDPSSLTISTDVYQLSIKESNPSLIDKLKITKSGSDSQTILDQFNKMYGFGSFDAMGVFSGDLSAGREGIWWDYSTPPNANSMSELIAVLDNPSVWYTQLSSDTSDPNRWDGSSPNYYFPSQGMYDTYVAMGHTPPSSWSTPRLDQWELNYGDKRAIVDGPIRVIQYMSQYLETGIYKPQIYGGGPESWVLVYTSMLDGPMYYYRNMQESPSASVAIPYMGTDITIAIYYVYIMCGTFSPTISSDITIYAGQEWSGGNDGVDQSVGDQPATFRWANEYGWTKIGGIDPKTTSYSLLGTSVPDGGGGAGNGDGDFYYSGGDPLQDANNAQAKPDANNGGTTNLPDWFVINSETHGGMWVYVPKREVFEIRDNFGSQSPALNSPGADVRLYYRDDGYHSEIGVAAVDGTGPINGGSSTSAYYQRYVYDVFTGNIGDRANLEYRRYWYSLGAISTFTPQTAPPSFHWEYATPDDVIYRQGDTITITAKGDRADAVIEADFSDIDSPANSYVVINNNDTTYTIIYNISNVNHGTTYERLIILNATVPSEPGWDDSLINITVNIDDIVPNPAASLDAIPATTQELIVYLNWTSNPGYDEGSSSVENPNGIEFYRIWRQRGSDPYILLKDNLPYSTTETTDTFLENGYTYTYMVEAIDYAGNGVNSTTISTTIDLPYTPAQPSDLAPVMNPSSGITIGWSENPGDYSGGVTLQNYYVYRSTSQTSGYVDVSGPLSTSTYSWTDSSSFQEATTYYYKVLSDVVSGTDLFSAPVYTKIDTVTPNPAIIAEFMPTYYAESNEIVVSWSIEKLPQYETGGYPGNDLNGIDRWDLFRQTNGGGWQFVASIPWDPDPEDQRYYDYSVSSGNSYTYGIRTYDNAGNFADSEYYRTTTLQVVGPGRCEVLYVDTSFDEVSPGDINIPVEVKIRNPGVGRATLNSIDLYFKQGTIETTTNYTDISWTGSEVFEPFTNKSYWFYVDVSSGAIPGLTEINARCTYNTTLSDGGAEFVDSWTVLPGSNLVIKTVSSSVDVVHPGETGITVSVMINNPGPNTASIDDVSLSFWRGSTDMSGYFLVSAPTPSYPIGPYVGDQLVSFTVDVSSAITSGQVIINATAQGKDSQSSIVISDTDGAETTKTWAVQTWPAPVISLIEANASTYWAGDTIELTVTCDAAGYQVSADFNPIDSTGGVVAGTDNLDGTYTILHTIGSTTPGEGSYAIQVTAVNATTSTQDQESITLKKGDPPQFSNWVQTPTDGNIDEDVPVEVNITITDNGGNDNVDAYLEYRVDLGSWIYLEMTYLGTGQWTVTIPGQSGGTSINYRIVATDLNSNSATYTASYSVNAPVVYPTIDNSYPHQEGNPGNQYSTTPGEEAPRDTNISHYAELGSTGITSPTTYVVVVSAFDSDRHCFLEANTTVIVQEPNPTQVTINLQIPSSLVSAGEYIYGHIYVLTDWPKNGGLIIASAFFNYNVS
ncbi:MAG: hypothetical protein ACTSPY_10330 [Candidatus Helarchaeota archaeon]